MQLNIGTTKSNPFELDHKLILLQPVCKNLCLCLDSKLSFQSSIDYMPVKLSKQCGVASKMRHFVRRKQLIEYVNTNITPIIKYGALIYCCYGYSSLQAIYKLQKKILKIIYIRKNFDEYEDLFINNSNLTVYDLHIYELLKFVARSISWQHTQTLCNKLFSFISKARRTRYTDSHFLIKLLCKRKIERFSIRCSVIQ